MVTLPSVPLPTFIARLTLQPSRTIKASNCSDLAPQVVWLFRTEFFRRSKGERPLVRIVRNIFSEHREGCPTRFDTSRLRGPVNAPLKKRSDGCVQCELVQVGLKGRRCRTMQTIYLTNYREPVQWHVVINPGRQLLFYWLANDLCESSTWGRRSYTAQL